MNSENIMMVPLSHCISQGRLKLISSVVRRRWGPMGGVFIGETKFRMGAFWD